MPGQVKVAIVGTGLAGLTAAYLLTQPMAKDKENEVKFEVHLFEKVCNRGLSCLQD